MTRNTSDMSSTNPVRLHNVVDADQVVLKCKQFLPVLLHTQRTLLTLAGNIMNWWACAQNLCKQK